MPRFWTTYWQFRFWTPDVNQDGLPLSQSGSNVYRARGVSVGDTVYVLSVGEGQLYLGGRMVVGKIVSREEAVRLSDNEGLYDASEWLVARKDSGTPLRLRRRLSRELTKQLRFVTPKGPQELFYRTDTHLDTQTLRGVRQLTDEAAELLDRCIAASEARVNSKGVVLVTSRMLKSRENEHPAQAGADEDEAKELVGLEGEIRTRMTSHRRRERRLRAAKIAAVSNRSDGALVCEVPNCGFDFRRAYGNLGAGYAQVHHLRPLGDVSSVRETRLEDLAIVCANCHAMIHRGGECRELAGLRLVPTCNDGA